MPGDFRGLAQPFLSTLPARGATPVMYGLVLMATFLSTLPARGATAAASANYNEQEDISIHAPREGSDSKCAEK